MIGTLLINLGTPDSPEPEDVKKYLLEFLLDPSVIDIPYLTRQFLVRGLIVPKRCKTSTQAYASIWTEKGSPLLYWSKAQQALLQDKLKETHRVFLAMRYGNPSIANTLESMRKEKLDEIVIIPLFPQYANATSGSIFKAVMQELSKWPSLPKIRWISDFYNHPLFIEAFTEGGKRYDLEAYDHVLMSFHGLPESQIKKQDQFGCCLKENCCQTITYENKSCYSAQCHATAQALAKQLDIKQWSICFQSRLGKSAWLRPYTSDVIHDLAKRGVKRLLVFCPAFVADCLETLYEIKVEYADEFKKAGGEKLTLVPSLNDEPSFIDCLASLSR